ncbi:MAG: CHASE2 domain-containing protein, partial [Candidatus Omnitrophica bacterium]|nr:CHASE2 domain-containing protein [Candidatus Omnitrophota bacterium]
MSRAIRKHNSFIVFFLIAVFVLTAIHFLPSAFFRKVSQDINDFSLWYAYTFSKKIVKPLKVVVIGIDDSSLNHIAQRWPWPRSLFAQLLEALTKEKVRTVGIDFAFVGESGDPHEDQQLADALKNASAPVVLAYFFDVEKGVAVFPTEILKASAAALGMLNTPLESDEKIRRLRAYIRVGGYTHYSFSVAMASAYLARRPEEISSSIPLSSDKTYTINYLLAPRDVVEVSFYDVLENRETLKRKYGAQFLKDALVLVCPEAAIFHDIHQTPLGRMPGGFTHLNGTVNAILGRFVRESTILTVLFLVGMFLGVSFLLRFHGFLIGTLFTGGLIVLFFWILVALPLVGIRYDFPLLVIFAVVFFISGSLYKYLSFLTQILRIKDKATLDPLRNMYTLRYFYYRFVLQMQQVYFGKDLFLVLIYFRSLQEETEELPLEKTKELWKQISSFFLRKGKIWSIYSSEELAGCMVCRQERIEDQLRVLLRRLSPLMVRLGLTVSIRCAYLKAKKAVSPGDMLALLSSAVRKEDREIISLEEKDGSALAPTVERSEKTDTLLESLDEDIEEKNRELLTLIDNLHQEHAKTKEAFFQIITSLVNALEARDSYTEGHSERVSHYALLLAERLGWPKEEKEK